MINDPRNDTAYMTFRLDNWFRSWEGPLTSQTQEDLDRNDLRGLWNFFYLTTLEGES